MFENEKQVDYMSLTRGGVDEYPPRQSLLQEPGDRQIPVQAVVLRAPKEPMHINGRSYDFSFDESSLVAAVNYSRVHAPSPGREEIRIVDLSLDAHDEQTENPSGFFDWRSGKVSLSTPKEVTDFSIDADKQAEIVQARLNRDLELGILHQMALNRRMAATRCINKASLLFGLAIGEGVGVASSNGSLSNHVIEGGLGALVGASVVGGVIFLKNAVMARGKILDTQYNDIRSPKALREAQAKYAERLGEYPRIPREFFDTPIIRVIENPFSF
jgi:hypothetical protein